MRLDLLFRKDWFSGKAAVSIQIFDLVKCCEPLVVSRDRGSP